MGKTIPMEERQKRNGRWDRDAVIEAESTIAMVFVLPTGLDLGSEYHHLLRCIGQDVAGRIKRGENMRASYLRLFPALQSARGNDNQCHLDFCMSDGR